MTILFVGGGTLGPVTPLMAVLRRMKKLQPELLFAWAGTPDGPERELIEREGVSFYPIPVAKFARQFSWSWFSWPSNFMRARRVVRELLDKVQPSLVVGLGGFTQVPVMQQAAKRGIKCAIHQLDKEPTLSNRLVASLCSSVTAAFEYETSPFGQVKTERVATPTRVVGSVVPDKEAGAERFFLHSHQPIVFVFGGGTGAQALNEAVWAMQPKLSSTVQIIHMTGKGKSHLAQSKEGYIVKEFLDEKDMLFAFTAADVIVCRAGMGTLSDLAALSKTAILVPIPDTHQEKNVDAVKAGVTLVEQHIGFAETLRLTIEELLPQTKHREELGKKLHELLPTDDGSALAERWLRLLKTTLPRQKDLPG